MLMTQKPAICKFAALFGRVARVALYSDGTGNGNRSRFSHQGKIALTTTEDWRQASASVPLELTRRMES